VCREELYKSFLKFILMECSQQQTGGTAARASKRAAWFGGTKSPRNSRADDSSFNAGGYLHSLCLRQTGSQKQSLHLQRQRLRRANPKFPADYQNKASITHPGALKGGVGPTGGSPTGETTFCREKFLEQKLQRMKLPCRSADVFSGGST
jgi:hypothetical protein